MGTKEPPATEDEVGEICIHEAHPEKEKELSNTVGGIEEGWISPTKTASRRQTMSFTNSLLDLEEFPLLSATTVKNSFGSLKIAESPGIPPPLDRGGPTSST